MGRLLGFIAGLLVLSLGAAFALVSCSPRSVYKNVETSNTGFSILVENPQSTFTSDSHALAAAPVVAAMSLEEKIRSLFIVTKPGLDEAVLNQYLNSTGAGGFILMGQNIPTSPDELATITTTLRGNPRFPRLVSIDEEGGEVKRLPYDTFPGANSLRNAPPAETKFAFSQRSNLLNSVGVNLNFGVVADVSSDPRSFIYGRSFGSDALSAGDRVSLAVRGEKASVVASTLKHFPGHGSAPGDSHTSVPVSELSLEQWRSGDAVPFTRGIQAGAQTVMFGHLSFPRVDTAPASLSATWHRILRDELGFTGVIITDDMVMLQRSTVAEHADPLKNAIAALLAGNDILLYVWGDDPSLFGIDIDELVAGIERGVKSGMLSERSIATSALRVMALRRSLASGADADPQVCNVACVFAYSQLNKLSAGQ